MNKASYDDQDWAKLVREIELAKAACKTPIDAPDAIAPIGVAASAGYEKIYAAATMNATAVPAR